MNQAGQPRVSRPELLPGFLFLVIGVGLLGTGLYRTSLSAYFRPLFFELAAALLVAAAGFPHHFRDSTGTRAQALAGARSVVTRCFNRPCPALWIPRGCSSIARPTGS